MYSIEVVLLSLEERLPYNVTNCEMSLTSTNLIQDHPTEAPYLEDA